MWPFDNEEDEETQPELQAGTPQPINPQVKDYLTQKYGLEQFSPEKRAEIEKANEEDRSGINWAAGLSALGAGIAGRDAGAAGQAVLNQQEAKRRGKLESFDKNRMLAMQDLNDKDMLARRERENDPNSEESKMAQSLATKMGMDPAKAATLTAAKFKEVSPALQKMYAIDEGFKIREQSAEDRKAELAQRNADRALEKQRLADAKAEKEEQKLSEKMQALQTPYGLANTVDDAKQLKAAHEAKSNFDAKIQEMIDLRKKFGGEVANREAVARGKQLSKDLLLEYKNMAKLGVLSQSDENIINAIIPSDPLEFTPSSLFGQDPILSNLTKFKADSERDFATKVATRTREGLAKGPPDTGLVDVIDPNGILRKVPKDKLEMALKAGGKLASSVAGGP